MSFNRKRDRIQIIAEILGQCRSPQTQTYVRRQTNLSYDVLQSCIMQLLVRQWLRQVEDENGQKRYVTTPKGMVFLEKWFELLQLAGVSKRPKLSVPLPDLAAINASFR
ncbi:MAG: winged helix-turn-helix domain-containing protein [Candidatus Bathyarchaeota archaeon]|nr:winged helix-turn-helix domain-containing protein [Candidatus Bathyarchaeota archaeon]